MLEVLTDGDEDNRFEDMLNLESVKFCKYLVGIFPDSYVSAKYVEGHKKTGLFPYSEIPLLDRFLLKISRIHPLLTKMADSYARIFYKKAAIRKKMLLLLAILECHMPYYSLLDTPDCRDRSSAYLLIFKKSLSFAATLTGSLLLIGPFHITFKALAKIFKNAL